VKLYYCGECGSDDIVWDAFASWNPVTQEHELRSIYDYCCCAECGDENIKERNDVGPTP
jgi:hypothetical protein